MYGWWFFFPGKYQKIFQIDAELKRKSGHSSFDLVVLSVGGVTSSLSCVSVPASGGGGVKIHPQYLGMVFVTVLYVERRACGTLGWLGEPFTSQVSLGLLLEAAKLPGLFYCRLLITKLVQRCSRPLWHQLRCRRVTGPVLFWEGGPGHKRVQCNLRQKTKKIGSFDQHDWWRIRVNLLPW